MNQIDGLRFIQVLKPTSRHAERRTVVTLDMAGRLELELTEGEIRKRARGRIPNEVWVTQRDSLMPALDRLRLFDGAMAGTQAIPRRNGRDQLYVRTLGEPPGDMREIWRHSLPFSHPVCELLKIWRIKLLQPGRKIPGHSQQLFQMEDLELLEDTEQEIRKAKAEVEAARARAEHERREREARERGVRNAARQEELGVPRRLAYEYYRGGPPPPGSVYHTKIVLDSAGMLRSFVNRESGGTVRQVERDALARFWPKLCEVGFPVFEPVRENCFPDEGSLYLKVEFESETISHFVPAGESERVSAIPSIRSFLSDLEASRNPVGWLERLGVSIRDRWGRFFGR